jgi:hypothetical protein
MPIGGRVLPIFILGRGTNGMGSYQDSWTGTSWRRNIQGSTLRVLDVLDDYQLQTAASNLETYCRSLGCEGPIVIGRGCHNIWRPQGFGNNGTQPLYALEVYLPDMSREQFIATFAKAPDNRQYTPGEVLQYGQQGELAVCLDTFSETAAQLHIYCPGDGLMGTFPNLPRQTITDTSYGYSVMLPIYGLIASMSQWAVLRTNHNISASNPVYSYWRQGQLQADIHDFRYLCYSQAKHSHVRVDPNDPNLAGARLDVDTYLRSFDRSDGWSDALRETATDYFVEIGLIDRAPLPGPHYGPTSHWGNWLGG